MTCLPQLVCMHGLPASDPAPFLEARDLLFWSCYMTNIHFYLQTSMTLLIPPLIPPFVACLCLSSNHIQAVFHLVLLLCGRVVAL